MTYLDYTILLPLLAGILLLIIPERVKYIKAGIALIIAAVVLYFSVLLYLKETVVCHLNLLDTSVGKMIHDNNTLVYLDKYVLFRVDGLSKLITLFIGFFTFLIIIYSLAYARRKKKYYNYYAYLLLTLGASNATALSDNLLIFITFWGFLGITLYKLIKAYDEESSAAAKKTFILIGSSDALMIIGIGIIWQITGSLTISAQEIPTDNALAITAFFMLLIGSFTKAGAFPFHSWIPEFTQKAPASSSAFLPASLDKLLGIYFMMRICHGIFNLNEWITLILLIIGVSTIIIAVMMALVQHNFKKLLGYHAVSQVGYMVTGLGLGTALGIVGGLFHMVNHALYKSGLFLSAGSVEEQTGKEDLDELGGLSGKMPVTFIAALIFALSISGIPPLNGFASKWIIYQAIIDFGHQAGVANNLWILWLALAVIGSALTLASFIKFISGIFLGRKIPALSNVREANLLMLIPMIILALFCIGFGVFATNRVVPFLFTSITGKVAYTGIWNSTTVSLLVLVSILLGFIIYLLGNVKKFRTDDSFIGGETNRDDTGYPVTNFYNTIRDFGLFASIYRKAEKKGFDIYYLLKNGVLWINNLLSKAHNGVLLNYAIWLVAGLIIMLFFLM